MNPLVWYAGLYSVSAAVLKIAGFAIFLWLARALPVEEYARFGLLYALQTGVATFAVAGVVEAVIGALREYRFASHTKQLFAAANSAFGLTASAVAAVALLVFALFAGDAGAYPGELGAVLASGALMAFASMQAQVIRLDEKHLSSLSFNFFVPLAGLCAGFVAFQMDRTLQSFFLGSLLGLAVSLVLLRLKHVGAYGMTRNWNAVRSLIVTGAPFVAVAFFGWLSGYGNNFIVSGLFETTEVARLTFALTVSSVMPLIAAALNQVWSPRFYRATHELPFEVVEARNRRFYRIQSVVLGVVGGLMILLVPSAIDTIGGNLAAYRAMELELVLLFSGYIVLGPWWHCHNYFLAYGKGSSVMRVVLLTSGIGIMAWVLLMWLLGPIGIYAGFLLQMLIRSIALQMVARKIWPIMISWGGVAGGVLLCLGGFLIEIR